MGWGGLRQEGLSACDPRTPKFLLGSGESCLPCPDTLRSPWGRSFWLSAITCRPSAMPALVAPTSGTAFCHRLCLGAFNPLSVLCGCMHSFLHCGSCMAWVLFCMECDPSFSPSLPLGARERQPFFCLASQPARVRLLALMRAVALRPGIADSLSSLAPVWQGRHPPSRGWPAGCGRNPRSRLRHDQPVRPHPSNKP